MSTLTGLDIASRQSPHGPPEPEPGQPTEYILSVFFHHALAVNVTGFDGPRQVQASLWHPADTEGHPKPCEASQTELPHKHPGLQAHLLLTQDEKAMLHTPQSSLLHPPVPHSFPAQLGVQLVLQEHGGWEHAQHATGPGHI